MESKRDKLLQMASSLEVFNKQMKKSSASKYPVNRQAFIPSPKMSDCESIEINPRQIQEEYVAAPAKISTSQEFMCEF